jgi:tetratricopeptide (TPR) repeat protein
MKSMVLAFMLAALPLGATAISSRETLLMLGPICGEGPDRAPIAGPHRLVMVWGMGNDSFPADTQDAKAQAWFDYGLTLARSFEHADAILAFRKAEALDPHCSLCVWGEAWARGPTINYPVSHGETVADLALARRARALASPQASPTIKALEAALVDRYRDGDARGAGDLAYAHDMDALNRADPANVEIAVSDAEAWLIRERYDDRSGLQHAVAVLEPLLARRPDSSGLLHFFIHATEEAGEPELAEPYAARVAELAPMASHMAHMPSHTFFRVGRYEDAALANLAALRTDRAYAEATDFPTPLGGLMYHFHDIHFGVVSAMMSGDGALALRLVRQFNRDFPNPSTYDSHAEMAGGMVFAAYGRFAAPVRVLAAADEVASRPYLEAMRHYARGEAYLRLRKASQARAEAAQISLPDDGSTSSAVAKIARLVLIGEADLLDRDPARAADGFREAAELQEKRLTQLDPPRWWFPVRRSLAEALLQQGDATGAAREATAVLKSWKLDPVALEIRSRARRALGLAGAARDHRLALRLWRGQTALAQAVAVAA